MEFKIITQLISSIILALPILALVIIVLNRILTHEVNENLIRNTIRVWQSLSLLLISILWGFFFSGSTSEIKFLPLRFGLTANNYLELSFIIDWLSLPFVTLIIFLGSIVGLFASSYLHRDKGFFRFFVLYHCFILGMHLIIQSGNLTGIYIGWEIVGLTSALLIAFFSFRRQNITNSLRAFWAYRITDIGLLVASLIAAHDLTVDGFDFYSSAAPAHASIILILCLISAMGKSAQFPFGHWLARAMEGPTPSSAIFYGGLSIHCGVYLLLRITEANLPLWYSLILILLGTITTIYGSTLTKVQTDVKSTLAFAAMAQVGLMFIEIGLGLRTIALIHCVGHALLRTYQLLNASGIFQDRILINKIAPFNTHQKTSKLYNVIFWESYSMLSDKWSMLRIIEKVSEKVRSFDLFCENHLFKFFQIIFVTIRRTKK